jgi:MinD superfamily P-loop ATPase
VVILEGKGGWGKAGFVFELRKVLETFHISFGNCH